MAQRRDQGFTLFSSEGRILGDYSSATDTPQGAEALREFIPWLPAGFYWVMTIRSDRFYLNRIETGEEGEPLITHPVVHSGRFMSTQLSQKTKSEVRALRRALLDGSKVPPAVSVSYLAAID